MPTDPVSGAAVTPGPAGSVFVDAAQSVTITGGASIDTSAVGAGGGNIRVLVAAPPPPEQSAARVGAGRTVTAADAAADAGKLFITNGGAVQASATGDGGNVQLYAARDIVIFSDNAFANDFDAKHPQPVISAASETLNGGNIYLGPVSQVTIDGQGSGFTAIGPAPKPVVTLRGAALDAKSAGVGDGGNIAITARALNDDPRIDEADEFNKTSKFGKPGTLTLDVVDLDRVAELAVLPDALADVSARIQPGCAMGLPGQISSFVAVGGGGLPPGPDVPMPAFDLRMPTAATAAGANDDSPLAVSNRPPQPPAGALKRPAGR
jgi:hypothetical protein